jgi:hypothetical protein
MPIILCKPSHNYALCKTGALPSERSRSALWRHAHSKPSQRDKTAKQQYLSPCEENALLDYVLRMPERGYPLPVKFLRSLALVIARQRSSAFQIPAINDGVRPPGQELAIRLLQTSPRAQGGRVKALDSARHDHNIYDKVMQWFTLISKELHDSAIVPENIYNMDETGVLLNVLSSLKVLVSKEDLTNCRGAGVRRILVTPIECISADGRFLAPLIVWPTSTHRSTWTTHLLDGTSRVRRLVTPIHRSACTGCRTCLTRVKPAKNHSALVLIESTVGFATILPQLVAM